MKNTRIPLLSCCLLIITFASAQSVYNVSLIPAALLEKANAVVRVSETRIDVKNEGKAFIHKKYAITILNAGGDEHGSMQVFYDKLLTIKNFSGDLYDAAGNRLKSLKKSDVMDVSGTASSNLADDSRVKTHSFNYKLYPYTVKYETTTELNGIFYFPSWIPLEDENLSVEKSFLEIEVPLDYNIRYKLFKINEPEITTGKNSKTLLWKQENLSAVKAEFFSVPWHETTPGVFLAPTAFRLQDYNGDMTDWSNFGKFMYALNAGRDQLPENIKSKIRSLISGVTSPKEKINILYKFLQENTRYISIQLGIGGWQTFDAASVASNGYGDCKALSNYMYSLLKEAGVKSHYALIKSGYYNHSFIPDFPSNQFNHVILCVPQEKDTIWLECTSQTMAPGYLGGFTSNRNALIIDEKGGTLVTTPRYSKTENLQSRKIISTLSSDGHLSIKVNTRYQAEQQDEVHGLLNALSKESIEEYLKDKLSIPSYDVIQYAYAQNKKGLPVIDEQLEIKAQNFATVTGKRIFITTNILNRSDYKMPDQKKRINPVKLSFEYTDIDSVEIELPDGYIAESIPADVSLKTPFGTYKSNTTFNPGKILYVRQVQRNSGYYPATDAVLLAEFYDTIYKTDRARVVLVKK
jgi:hypothetical protein